MWAGPEPGLEGWTLGGIRKWSQITGGGGGGVESGWAISRRRRGQSPGWGFGNGWGQTRDWVESAWGRIWTGEGAILGVWAESEPGGISSVCPFSHADPCFPPGADRQGIAVGTGPGATDRAPGTRRGEVRALVRGDSPRQQGDPQALPRVQESVCGPRHIVVGVGQASAAWALCGVPLRGTRRPGVLPTGLAGSEVDADG